MKLIAYNSEQQLVVTQHAEGVSSFGLSPEAAVAWLPGLQHYIDQQAKYPLCFMAVSDDQYEQLYAAHQQERFDMIDGYEVPKGTPRSIVKTLRQAQRGRSPVFVEYEDGHGYLSDDGIHSHDGRCHVCWIGQSTGERKLFLHLDSLHASGGPAFSFAGLMSVKIARGC